MYQPPKPVEGIPVKAPLHNPLPNQVVTHYEVFEPETGCCKCDGMKPSGVIAIILLLFFFWPLAFLPCLMEDCFEKQQRPVYGYPSGQGQAPSIPVGQPVSGQPVPGEGYAKADKPPPI